MIRNRLAKLERLLADVLAGCPGCKIAGLSAGTRVVMLPDDPLPNGEPVRCALCGRRHRPNVITVIFG